MKFTSRYLAQYSYLRLEVFIMKENKKRNIIDNSSLIATTVTGVLGVATGIPVIQAAAYLPPIVQAFFKKIDVDNKIGINLSDDLKNLILSTCEATKNQLQQKNASIADFFDHACARIEFELMKDFSVENVDVYFKGCIERDARCECMDLTDKDLQDLVNIFMTAFINNLPYYSRLADYLSTLILFNHEQRIRSLEKKEEDENPDSSYELINSNSTDEVRKISKKYFNIIKNRGRFKGYSEVQESKEVITKIADVIFLKNLEGSIEKTLEEIVFPQEMEWKDSISLCGKGGSGKTYQFLRLIEIILDENNNKYHEIIPFYLEINDIKKNQEEPVLYSISMNHGLNVNKLKDILETHASQCIIFADGLNEITDRDTRGCVIDDICNIREKYKTRVVLSSRDDHSQQFNSRNRGSNQKFTAAKVCDLKPSQINKYFEICLKGCNITLLYSDIMPLTQHLLCTAQGLSMYMALFKSRIKKGNYDALEFSSLGKLLQSYCDWILEIDRTDDSENLSFEKYMMKIAYNMVLKGIFQIDERDVIKVLGKKGGRKKLENLKSNNKAIKIFASHGTGNYEFSHQNFRDYYAALRLSNVIKSICENNINDIISKYITNNYMTTNDEILSLCSDFLSSNDIQKVIDCIRKLEVQDYSFALCVLIKLYSFIHSNDISSMNLSGLDLTSVSLSNYKLYSMRDRNSFRSINLYNSVISEDTFLLNALQDASSTICSYECDGKLYVTAFSASNALTYNIEDNIWESYRDMPNKNWVNCCCIIKDCIFKHHQTNVILLGYDDGTISVFNKNYKAMNLYKPQNNECSGIESILCVNKNGRYLIVFCDSIGRVFLINCCSDLSSNCYTIHLLNRFNNEMVESVDNVCANKTRHLKNSKKIIPCSRLTKSDKHIYLCFGSSIYVCDADISPATRFKRLYSFDKDTFVKDIFYASDGLFINKLDEVVYLNISNKSLSEPFAIEKQSLLQYFTKFSWAPDNSAIIGVCIVDNDFSEVSNFYKLSYDKINNKCIGNGISRGMQTMTTYTGAYFMVPRSDQMKLATVSDDRSVQILSPDDENIETIRHNGSYDGVHYIDALSPNEFLAAQYDGSVSYWKRDENENWQCMDSFHIHTDWVWKVKHYINDGHIFFISCSYDGTVKRTCLSSGETEILISDDNHNSFIDFCFDESLNFLLAITDKSIYYWQEKNNTVEKVLIENEKWKDYHIRSVDMMNDEKSPLIAINYTTNNNTARAGVYRWSNGKLICDFTSEAKCTFIRCLKTYVFKKHKLLVIAGNRNNDEYFGFYLYENGKWNFKCSLYECLMPVSPGLPYPPVNDFALYLNSVNEEMNILNFKLFAVHKSSDGENRSYYSIKLTDNGYNMDEGQGFCSSSNYHYSQPMSVCIADNRAFIGMLNGDIYILDNDDPSSMDFGVDYGLKMRKCSDYCIKTHSNLTACIHVKLGKSKFISDIDSKRFRETFSGYFDFDN